jgi:chemotaxis protein methyltransferase CheR
VDLAALPELTPAQFSRFSRLIEENSGIHLGPQKTELLRARLMRRMRTLGMGSFRAYYRRVAEDATGRELDLLLDHVTTNKTEFFREPQHFSHFARWVLPAWQADGARRGEPLRVWSAACSTGEEVWSLAMTTLEWLGPEARVKFLGTDLSSRVLHVAKGALYPEERMGGIPIDLRGRYWEERLDEGGRSFLAGTGLRTRAQFHRFNLMGDDDYPFRNKFDAVFCRNVMIYFDRDQQERVVNRMARVIKPGGYLYVGLSESLLSLCHPFKLMGVSVYQLAP